LSEVGLGYLTPTIQPLLEPKTVLLPSNRRIWFSIRRNGRHEACAVWVLELTDLG